MTIGIKCLLLLEEGPKDHIRGAEMEKEQWVQFYRGICATPEFQHVCDSLLLMQQHRSMITQTECRATPRQGCNLSPLSSSSRTLTHTAHIILPTRKAPWLSSNPEFFLKRFCAVVALMNGSWNISDRSVCTDCRTMLVCWSIFWIYVI